MDSVLDIKSYYAHTVLIVCYCPDDIWQLSNQCLITTSISSHVSVSCLGWLYFMLCSGETGIQVLNWFQLYSICLPIPRPCGTCFSHGDSQKGKMLGLKLAHFDFGPSSINQSMSHSQVQHQWDAGNVLYPLQCAMGSHGKRVENWIKQTASGHYSKTSIVLA